MYKHLHSSTDLAFSALLSMRCIFRCIPSHILIQPVPCEHLFKMHWLKISIYVLLSIKIDLNNGRMKFSFSGHSDFPEVQKVRLMGNLGSFLPLHFKTC